MKVNKFTVMLNEKRETYLVSEGYTTDLARRSANTPSKIYNMLCETYNANMLPEEHAWIICLDTQLKCKGVFELTKGSVNSSIFPARETFRNALLVDAVNIIIAHNHPSGNINPSKEDIATTHTIMDAGKIVGINLLDHIIIGDSYYSMKEDGLI